MSEHTLREAIEALCEQWSTEGQSLIRHCHGPADVYEGQTLELCAHLLAELAAANPDSGHALEMSRKAEQAERRAEEAEYHVEQLRDARDSAERRIERTERLIDSWERDAPDHSNPVFIGRLRETLRRDPAPVRLLGTVTVGDRQVPGCWVETPSSGECEHDWLDRPESDTRECPICGTEVSA